MEIVRRNLSLDLGSLRILVRQGKPILTQRIFLQTLANNLRELSSLCFSCARCCKDISPIRVTMQDARRISDYLNVPLSRYIGDNLILTCGNFFSFKKTRPCKYLKSDGSCEIYTVRPTMCMCFPFLSEHARDQEVIEVPTWCRLAVRVHELAGNVQDLLGIARHNG